MSVAAHTRSRVGTDGRVRCANAAVCRMSAYADSYRVYSECDCQPGALLGRMEPTGICPRCHYAVGYALDIAECDGDEECSVCLRPMHLGVKWPADACQHRFCPACSHQMLFGLPRPTHESYQTRLGGHVELHDDGRMVSSVDDTFALGDAGCTGCPMCRAPRKMQPWMEPTRRTVTGIWLHGATGTGKTHAARCALTAQFGERGYFVFGPPLEFKGYNLECGMLVDDYDGESVSAEQLLRIISGEALSVDPGHGAHRLPLLTEFVVITALREPRSYFPEGSPVLGSLMVISMD